MPHPSLDTSRAARRADVHEDTIRKAAHLGELRGYKLAGRSRWRLDSADIDRRLAGQSPAAQAGDQAAARARTRADLDARREAIQAKRDALLEDRLARVVDPDQFREADARFRAEQGEVDLARRRLDAAGQVDAPGLWRTAAWFLDNLRAVFLRAAPELRRDIVDCAFAEVVVDAGEVRTQLKGSVFNMAAEADADLRLASPSGLAPVFWLQGRYRPAA